VPVCGHLSLESYKLTLILVEARILPAKTTHLNLRLWVKIELLSFLNRSIATVWILVTQKLEVLVQHLLLTRHRQLEGVLLCCYWGLLWFFSGQ
jgi:hypothetical protein